MNLKNRSLSENTEKPLNIYRSSHNNGFKIKEYLPALIETAQSQGYEFVTVSELTLSGNTIIDVNGAQKSA